MHAPRDAAEAEALLRRVPELIDLPELASLVRGPIVVATWPPVAGELATCIDPELTARVAAGLRDLHARADREGDGGLAFLAGALAHFLAPERALAPLEHPLIVALLVRAAAQARGQPHTPPAVAALMDLWT